MDNVYSTFWNVTDLKLFLVFFNVTPRSRFLGKRVSAVVSLDGIALVAGGTVLPPHALPATDGPVNGTKVVLTSLCFLALTSWSYAHRDKAVVPRLISRRGVAPRFFSVRPGGVPAEVLFPRQGLIGVSAWVLLVPALAGNPRKRPVT